MTEFPFQLKKEKGGKQNLLESPIQVINKQSNDLKMHRDEGDTVSTTVSSTSLDPSLRKYSSDERNAISKHSLGVYYIGKEDWDNALDNLQLALKARKQVFGKKDPHIAETKMYFAEVIAALGDKEKAIAILQKTKKMIEYLREEKRKKNVREAKFSENSVDLDKLNEVCVEKLEKLGIKTNKFVKKNATVSKSGQDIFGQDYKLMRQKEGSLDDPDVFVRVMQTEDLTQDEINKGIKGLNEEIQDVEIYFTSQSDEELADLKTAGFIDVLPTLTMDVKETEDFLFTDIVDYDALSVDSEDSGKLTEKSFISEKPESLEESKNNNIEEEIQNPFFYGFQKQMNLIGLNNAFAAVSQTETSDKYKSSRRMSLKQLQLSQRNIECEPIVEPIARVEVDYPKVRIVERRKRKLASINEIKIGDEMLSRGDIFQAEKFYKKNIVKWIDILGYENPYVIQAKEDLGDIKYLTGNFMDAKQNYQVAVRTTKRLNNYEPCNDTVRLLEKLAMTHMELKQIDTANDIYNEAIEMADQLFQFDVEIGSVTKQDFWYHRALVHFKIGNYDLARLTLAKNIRFSKSSGSQVDPKVYNLIGIVFFAETRYSNAKHYFEKAFSAIANFDNFPMRHKINFLYNLGNASNQLELFDYALHCFNWANHELNHPGYYDFDQKFDRIRILTNIGHCHFHLKNFELAYTNYSKAYSLDLGLFNDETRLSAIDIRRYIGVTRSSQGKYDDALFIFEEILYSQKEVEWTNDTTVGKVLLDICEIYLIGGSKVLSSKYQLRLAASCCKRALEIFNHKKFRSEHPYMKQANKLKKIICQILWGDGHEHFRSRWENLN